MARGNFGERLKRERELREVTLEEITSATRIGPRFLEALENEDWEKLPGGVFNRGFVRSIARYLGLNEEVLLGEYDLAHGTQVAPAAETQEERIPRPSKWVPALVVLGVLVLLAAIAFGILLGWRYYKEKRNAKAAPAVTSRLLAPEVGERLVATSTSERGAAASSPFVPSAAVASVATRPVMAPSTRVAGGPLELTVSASAATHLLVLADGHVAFYDEVRTGETKRFTAEEGYEVTASDSGAVLLELNGQVMPALGVPGPSGTMKLSQADLRQATGGNPKR